MIGLVYTKLHPECVHYLMNLMITPTNSENILELSVINNRELLKPESNARDIIIKTVECGDDYFLFTMFQESTFQS